MPTYKLSAQVDLQVEAQDERDAIDTVQRYVGEVTVGTIPMLIELIWDAGVTEVVEDEEEE